MIEFSHWDIYFKHLDVYLRQPLSIVKGLYFLLITFFDTGFSPS
mgnify:CR=1 FL=1